LRRLAGLFCQQSDKAAAGEVAEMNPPRVHPGQDVP
jgi:hypothetical protein